MASVYSLTPFNHRPVELIVKGVSTGIRCNGSTPTTTAFAYIAAYNVRASEAVAFARNWESTAIVGPVFFPTGAITAFAINRFLGIGDWRNANYAQGVNSVASLTYTQTTGTVRDIVLGPSSSFPPSTPPSGQGYPVTSVAVVFSGGGGSGAVARAIIIGGKVVDFIVDNAGSGYTSNPTATAPNPDVNKIFSVTVTNGGSGFTSVPTISFSGGGGSGAAATAVISGGKIRGIIITNKGSGYTSNPTVTTTGGGGSGAILAPLRALSASQIAVLLARSFATVSIGAGGSGFTDIPEVYVSGDGAGSTFLSGTVPRSGGSGAEVIATISGGVVNSVTLVNGGAGYETLVSPPASIIPAITIIGGKFSTSVVPLSDDTLSTCPNHTTDTSVRKHKTEYKFRRLGTPIPMTVRWDVRKLSDNSVISMESLTITAADADSDSASWFLEAPPGDVYIVTNFRIEVPI